MLPLTSRFKILSRLDIAERRLPQDGRISIKIDDRAIDFRISTVPAKYGEKIVMRVLDKSAALLPLDKIVDHQEVMEKVRWMIHQPYGIIYVTGPTGSGKTTTLYSSLGEINSPGIILVGETRDRETAGIAVEAALTGHLVFTTLHTNDAPGAFTRLQEMGVEPFLMSSSTIGIMAQRLARRICKNCKEESMPDEATAKFFGYDMNDLPTFYKGKGCDQCGDNGYKGRVGVYEVMIMNDELRRLVSEGATSDEVRDCAIKHGMMTLQNYAEFLLKKGLTTVDAVMGVIAMGE
jgi:type II secretory ATPase GspE/PulE/Tfp pilus assembly ATPase PilB-like protein